MLNHTKIPSPQGRGNQVFKKNYEVPKQVPYQQIQQANEQKSGIMPSRHFNIAIHIKPWVKKYIVANYGESILISMRNPASIVLYSFLQKQNIPFRVNAGYIDKRFTELSQTISLVLDSRDRYKHGLFMRKENQLLINNYFEQEISKRIYGQCEVYSKVKLSRETAVEDFCDQYDIELHKDINLEAMLKAEYRHRIQIKIRKEDRANMSAPCSTPVP